MGVNFRQSATGAASIPACVNLTAGKQGCLPFQSAFQNARCQSPRVSKGVLGTSSVRAYILVLIPAALVLIKLLDIAATNIYEP